MGMGKPGGDYVEQLTEPGGWTEADEDELYRVASAATRALQQLTFGAFDPWQRERSETFDGGNWSGDAAGAASGKAGKHSEEFAAQQNNLVSVVTWNNHVAGLVAKAKSTITDNVVEAQGKIREIKNFSFFGSHIDALIQLIAISRVISTYHGRNVREIAATGAEIPAASAWKSPPTALEQLLSQKQPPETPAAQDTPMSTLMATPPLAPAQVPTGSPTSTPGTSDTTQTATAPAEVNPPPHHRMGLCADLPL
ncbi:hypothetical protein [Mycolicibacterium fortuitum]|uniref:hypothetical protein n=1 Tax=Mycolicibacterium fortuitum TaxID=1766 RepID=UPI0007EA02EB|nr:hypothetical protein [Mycolicibacterium fortuitum]OBB50952.1 hypothetical protein A5754_25010 [Mycolicibacterium fortuitum]